MVLVDCNEAFSENTKGASQHKPICIYTHTLIVVYISKTLLSHSQIELLC